jgi:hypothetical protein
MPGNNETETLQVLTDLCGADDMNNFSVFLVSQSLKTVKTTCKTGSLTTHQTYKNVEIVKKLVCADRQTVKCTNDKRKE